MILFNRSNLTNSRLKKKKMRLHLLFHHSAKLWIATEKQLKQIIQITHLHKWMFEYICITNLTQMNVRIDIENDTNIWIYSKICIFFLVWKGSWFLFFTHFGAFASGTEPSQQSELFSILRFYKRAGESGWMHPRRQAEVKCCEIDLDISQTIC